MRDGRWLLRIGAGIVTMIGLAHLVMPFSGYDPSLTADWTISARDHFYFLGTYAIAGFLLSFGVLAFSHASRLTRESQRLWAVMVSFWAFRLVLEWRYPVDVPIFGVPQPHLPLMLVVMVLVVLFGLGGVLQHLAGLRRRASF